MCVKMRNIPEQRLITTFPLYVISGGQNNINKKTYYIYIVYKLPVMLT